MFLSAETLDDLLHKTLKRIFAQGRPLHGSNRGSSRELHGVLLELTNPLARLSHAENRSLLFGCLGELLWYMSGRNDLSFIGYYLSKYASESEDGRVVYGGYGPRLFGGSGENQILNIILLLITHPQTRRAVIQLFDAKDIAQERLEIPCTNTLQFLIRDGRLHLLTSMRSNDAFQGLPHDVFAFTMIQEFVARILGVEVGSYRHCVGSLHLYDEHRDRAKAYLQLGLQETKNVAMAPMPNERPWSSMDRLLRAEDQLRLGKTVRIDKMPLAGYWCDLVRILLVYRHYVRRDWRSINRERKLMSSPVFDAFIEAKATAAKADARTQVGVGRAVNRKF